jgi:hypothetical protein
MYIARGLFGIGIANAYSVPGYVACMLQGTGGGHSLGVGLELMFVNTNIFKKYSIVTKIT